MQVSLYSYVASLRSTGLFFQSLEIRAYYNDVAFCFWDSSLYITNNLICIITRKSFLFRQIEQGIKLKLITQSKFRKLQMLCYLIREERCG